MQLRHIGIVCKDLEASLYFYCKFFGCSLAKKMDESGSFISKILNYEGVEVTTVKLIMPAGEGQIELLSFVNPLATDNASSLFSKGISHFALKVDNLKKLYETMVDEGVSFLSAPQLSDDGFATVAFCRDPDGVYIELVEIMEN